MRFLLAQISDLHVTEQGRVPSLVPDTAPFVRAAIDQLNRLDPRPDLVLISGDLADNGTPEQYTRLAELLGPLTVPMVLLAGNHDDREALRAAFPAQPWQPGLPWLAGVVDDHAVRLVLLDSVIPGQPGGLLGHEQLAWLDRLLRASPARPTVLAVHHPPFVTGIQHMDAMGLANADELAEVVRPHDHVQLVLSGHLHRSITSRWAGTVAMTVPGVAHQVGLDLRPDAPLTLTMEPPALALHAWLSDSDEAGPISHLQAIGKFAVKLPR